MHMLYLPCKSMSTEFEHTNKEARNKTITKFQGFSPVQLTLHHAITSAPTITRSVWGGQKAEKPPQSRPYTWTNYMQATASSLWQSVDCV